jgi:hypothetical protein
VSTDALDLLDGAAAVLRELAPTLGGEARYTALLSANAIATARRDLALRDRSAAARAGLPADAGAIRSGAHDGDATLYGRIFAHAVLRAWIADPSALTEAERAAFVEGAG